MGRKTLLRIGDVQKSILERLLSDYVLKHKGEAKNNRIVRSEYNIVRKMYYDLTQRGRLCPTCGQRVKT